MINENVYFFNFKFFLFKYYLSFQNSLQNISEQNQFQQIKQNIETNTDEQQTNLIFQSIIQINQIQPPVQMSFFKCCFTTQAPPGGNQINNKNKIYINNKNNLLSIQQLKSPISQQQQKSRKQIGGIIVNNSSFKLHYNVYNVALVNSKSQPPKLPSQITANTTKDSSNRNSIQENYIKTVYEQTVVQIQHHRLSKLGLKSIKYGKQEICIIAEDHKGNIALVLDKYLIKDSSCIQLIVNSNLTLKKIQYEKLLEINFSMDQKTQFKKPNIKDNTKWTYKDIEQDQKKNKKRLEFIQLPKNQQTNKNTQNTTKEKQSIFNLKPTLSSVQVEKIGNIKLKESQADIYEDVN